MMSTELDTATFAEWPNWAAAIDGVLNSRRYFAERNNNGLTWEQSQIDPAAVAILNRVLAATGAVVVISSSWRPLHKSATIWRTLRCRGFTGRVIGATPDLSSQMPGVYVEQGHEIQAWLDAQSEPPSAFVIVDDDADMAHLAHRLVRTDNAVGLTNADAAQIVAMLGGSQ